MRFQHECFAFLAQSSFYIDSIWFRHFAETRLRALPLSRAYTDECLLIIPVLSQIIKTLFYLQPMGKWPASALPVTDAVSFEFDDINVTAQHVSRHRQRLCLFSACSPFTTSSSDYRGSQVSAHWCFYERTSEREVGYKRLMPVCRRSLLWNSATDDDIDGGISAADATSS